MILIPSTESLTVETLKEFDNFAIVVFYMGLWRLCNVLGSRYNTKPDDRWLIYEVFDDYAQITEGEFSQIKSWYILPRLPF